MSGLKTSVLAFLLCAGSLSAQFLPDIDRFEVEDVRLVLLDGKGVRRGVLTGELARKQRDGKVHIEGAELRVDRGDDAFVLTSDVFDYTPDTSAFDCPEGLRADLPRGGLMVVPKGNGTIKFDDGVQFDMTVDGEATLRDGSEGAALVDARVMNPEISAKFRAAEISREVKVGTDSRLVQADTLALELLKITGTQGGECKLTLSQLPSVLEKESKEAAVVTLGCFGDVSVIVREKDAELHMLRRARMALDDNTFEVTSGRIDVLGNIVPPGQQAAAALSGLSIDAEQNVNLKGQAFSGRCGLLKYREPEQRREIRLEQEPELTFNQGQTQKGEPAALELSASDYIDVQVPNVVEGGKPSKIDTELSGNACASRLVAGKVEWQIRGTLVKLASTRVEKLEEGATEPDDYNHSFSATAVGYSPLLRVAGLEAEQGRPLVERATVFGDRGDGTYIAGREAADGKYVPGQVTANVYGAEVLGVVYSDAPIADFVKIALGLKEPPKDDAGNPLPPPPRDGRLTVRSASVLQLEIATGGPPDLKLNSEGNVELDHEPLPRDDADLLTLTADKLSLVLKEGRLLSAGLQAAEGQDAVATLGFDIVLCRDLASATTDGVLHTTITGPGRLVVREPASVEYFRKALDRLPKRPGGPKPIEPDAAWLDFAGTLKSTAEGFNRDLDVGQPDFRLVYGDFEGPRAGRTAVNDLPELLEPGVQLLYRIAGARMFASSRKAGEKAPAVNLLRLEGDAFVDSRLDRFTGRAAEAIELSGSENQAEDDSPFSLVLLRDAHLVIESAALFFGEYVSEGVFAYDGAWTLDAADRLEVTFRPIEGAGDGSSVARDALFHATQNGRHSAERVHLLEVALESLRTVTAGPRPIASVGDRPWAALNEATDAHDKLRRALWHEMLSDPGHLRLREQGLRAAKRARGLLSALIDVAGRGGLSAEFKAESAGVPPLKLAMDAALFTFDGLGQVMDVSATGPVTVAREAYTVQGAALKRSQDGTLTLEDASITLPPETGVVVVGVRKVALKQGHDKLGRALVTRITGKKLSVGVKLKAQQEK